MRNIPVTLVNEYESTMLAKAKIFERISQVAKSSGELNGLLAEMRSAAMLPEER